MMIVNLFIKQHKTMNIQMLSGEKEKSKLIVLMSTLPVVCKEGACLIYVFCV